MTVHLLVTNIVDEIPQTFPVEVTVSERATIQELLDTAGYGTADLSDYYSLSGVFAWNDFHCPYLFSHGKALYNVPYSAARLQDFYDTFDICDSTLRIVYGYPQAGGPGNLSIEEIWDGLCLLCRDVFPYLNVLAIFCTVFGFSVRDIFRRMVAPFIKKGVPPHTVEDILSSREQWNHRELAALLDIPEKNARQLLRGFGYRYDRHKMLYVPGELSAKIRKGIKYLDIHE